MKRLLFFTLLFCLYCSIAYAGGTRRIKVGETTTLSPSISGTLSGNVTWYYDDGLLSWVAPHPTPYRSITYRGKEACTVGTQVTAYWDTKSYDSKGWLVLTAHSESWTIYIDPIEPTGITLNTTSVSLYVGNTKQLSATVNPSGVSQSVTWSVPSGSSYVSVSSSGLVTAKAVGTATVRATSEVSSSVYKDCTVEVKNVPAPTSISLNYTSVSLTLGDTRQLSATVSPSSASQIVTWSVPSGSSYVSVHPYGGLVTAKAAGTATVRATSTADSSVYKNCTVTVTEPVIQPGTWSGDTLTIGGNATKSDYEVPYSNFYLYSTTQMLYTPKEIGKSGEISSIAFRVASSESHTTSNVKVYLGHKSGIFSSTSDYVKSSNLTLVYSGAPTLGSTTGWETLTFNQGTFNYNGTENLVVVITRSATSITSSLKYYCYTGSGYTLYQGYFYKEEDYGDVSNTLYSYEASTNRPAIRLTMTVKPSGIAIDATNFPDANFRNWLLQQSYGSDGILTQDEINAVKDISVGDKSIQSLKGIEHFTALECLQCNNNQLTTLDVSKNTALTVMGCYKNQISGSNMDALINSLPTVTSGNVYIVDVGSSEEKNVCTKSQVAAIREKGWSVYAINNGEDEVYEGSDEAPEDNFGLGKDEFMAGSIYYSVVSKEGDAYNVWVKKSPYNDYKGYIVIPETFNIGEKTFRVVGIDDNAFENSDVVSVVIPSTVKSIDDHAFANCRDLKSIYSNITDLSGTHVSTTAFEGITLEKAVLYVPFGTIEQYRSADAWSQFTHIIEAEAYVKIDGIYYGFTNNVVDIFNEELDGKDFNPFTPYTHIAIVLGTPRGEVTYSGDIVIPSSVSHNGNTFPVAGIASEAFAGTGITSITLPSSLRVIGADAIAECRSLKEVVIPEGVVVIYDEAFVESYNIERIELPSTLRKIWDEAFADCEALKELVSHMKNPMAIKNNVFRLDDDQKRQITLYVPYGAASLYRATDGWKEFQNIVELEEEKPVLANNQLYAQDKSVARGGNAVLPIILKNEDAIRLFQFDLTLPIGVTVATGRDGEPLAELTARAGNKHSLSCIQLENGDYRFIVSQNSIALFSGNDGAVVNITLAIAKDVSPDTYPICMKNIELTLYKDGSNVAIELPNNNSVLTVKSYVVGDATGDGNVTVTDIAVTVDLILSNGYNVGADADGNGKVTVTDIATIVDIILSRQATSRQLINKLDSQ